MALYIWLSSRNKNVTSPIDSHVLLSPAASPSCSASVRECVVPQPWRTQGTEQYLGQSQSGCASPKIKDSSSRLSVWQLNQVSQDAERLVQKLWALSGCGELSFMEIEGVQKTCLVLCAHNCMVFSASSLWLSHRNTMVYIFCKVLLSWHEDSKL